MHARSLFSNRRQGWVIVFSILLTVVVIGGLGAALVVGEEDLVQPDGRVNQVMHFGGDALYCVDRNFEATNQYSDFGQGGFRLLNQHGNELWFVPALDISAAVAEAKTTGDGVLVGEGLGTYGPVSIWTYVTSARDDYFIFTGFDEYHKPNSLTFKFCIPVGPDAPDPETPAPPAPTPLTRITDNILE